MKIKYLQKDHQDLTYDNWVKALIRITTKETGITEDEVKVNHEVARQWYNDGFTPYACFRENWCSDGDI